MCVFHFHEFDSLMESYSEMKLLPSAIQLRSAAEGAKLSRNTKKNKWINFGFRCFEHTNTHTHTNTEAYTHSRARNVVVIAVGFWTFTAKLENLLLIYFVFFLFFEPSRRRCHSRRRNNRRQNYNWTNNTPSEAAHADSAAWGVAAAAASLLELEFEYWKMRRHEA